MSTYYRKAKKATKSVKGYANKAMTTAETAMKAYTLAKSVAALVNSEYKYRQWANNGVVIDDAATSGPAHRFFNGTAQDDTHHGREGDSVRVKNIVIRGSLHHTGGGSPTKPTQLVRLVLIREFSEATIEYVGDLVEPTTVPSGTAAKPWALPLMVFNKNNKKKFQVLYDKTWNLSDDNPNAYINITKKVDKHLVFNKGATSVASGEIKLFVFGNEPSVSAPSSKPFMELYTHASYIDN